MLEFVWTVESLLPSLPFSASLSAGARLRPTFAKKLTEISYEIWVVQSGGFTSGHWSVLSAVTWTTGKFTSLVNSIKQRSIWQIHIIWSLGKIREKEFPLYVVKKLSKSCDYNINSNKSRGRRKRGGHNPWKGRKSLHKSLWFPAWPPQPRPKCAIRMTAIFYEPHRVDISFHSRSLQCDGMIDSPANTKILFSPTEVNRFMDYNLTRRRESGEKGGCIKGSDPFYWRPRIRCKMRQLLLRPAVATSPISSGIRIFTS